ncbi:DUF7660 family protein [Ruegeria arenilitoris]|uniref:DUF7660 family protein n=1 Tax=Ruegeria arenilitoris TaxID=1173585 RepID=UPI001481132F|nr:hypothetical protein [Ruegeria arenilitoris]
MNDIKSSADFADALSFLLDGESFPAENTDTRRFVEAMQAWLRDVEGNNNWFDKPSDDYITWSDLYKLLQAASVYE